METIEKAEYAEMSNQRPPSQPTTASGHKAPDSAGPHSMDNGPTPGSGYPPPPHYPPQHGYPQGLPQQGYPPQGYPYAPHAGGPPPHQGYPGYPPYHHPGSYTEPYMGGPPPMPHGSMPPPPGAAPPPPGPHPVLPVELPIPPGVLKLSLFGQKKMSRLIQTSYSDYLFTEGA